MTSLNWWIKESSLSKKDIQLCADIWDHSNEETADQILHELGVDHSWIESGGYMKADCGNGFFSMKLKYQRMIVNDFEEYNGSCDMASETFNEMIYQVKNPKDMYQTERWWLGMDIIDREDLFNKYETEEMLLDDCSLEWNKIEHHIQWFIHEVRMIELFPYIDLGNGWHKAKLKALDQKRKPKNYKVTCWHCGNSDQKVLSFDEAFECTKCDELLWIGDGGYVEQVEGIYQ